MKEGNGQRIFDPQPLMRGLVKRHISADDLAKEIKSDHRTVYRALDGGSVNVATLAKICRALDVAVIRFLVD